MTLLNRIFISSSKLIVDKPDGADKKLPEFRLHQLVKAKVIQNLSSRKALLRIAGKNITAKTSALLKPDETVLLKVIKPGLQPVFSLIDDLEAKSMQHYQTILKSMDRSGPYKELLTALSSLKPHMENGKSDLVDRSMDKLQKLLFSTALGSEKTEPGILEKLIRNSGLIWENKLRNVITAKPVMLQNTIKALVEKDMKALASELVKLLHDKDSTLQKGMSAFLDNLEALQILNRLSFEESGRLLIHLPVLFENQIKFGQMLMDLDTKEGSDKDHKNRLIRVAFLLELTNIGDFLAEFSILKNSVSGSFGVTSDAHRIFVESHIPELESKLNVHGFNVHRIECRVISPETLSSTSLVDRLLENYEGVLNVVV